MKRGFNNARFKTRYALVNLSDLSKFDDGASIDEKALLGANLIRGNYDGIKILGNGEITKKLAITADKVSASARAKIEKAGGSIALKREANAK